MLATDADLKNFTLKEVRKRVSQVSKVPILGLYEFLLGDDIVGGSLLSYQRIGIDRVR